MEREDEIDAVTLRRAARGDRSARAALVHRYQKVVFVTVSRVLGRDADEVDDVAQDTFVRALRSLHTFDVEGPARLSTWLCTIAVRRALDVARRRHRVVSLDDARHAIEGEAPTTDPGDAIDDARARAALRRTMERLGPDHRAVMVLRVEHEMPLDEIAKTLGVEVGTVKSRLSRAKAQLTRSLAIDDPLAKEDHHAR